MMKDIQTQSPNLFQKLRILTLGLLISLPSIFSGCSSLSVDEDDPASLMAEVEAEIESHHYLLALEKLQKIAHRFPYSDYSVKAQLRKADVYFYQESFTEAAFSYENFQELHPKHPQTAYAAFQQAEAYRSEAPSQIARDLTSVKKASEAYQKFIQTYRQDPNRIKAEEKLKEMLEVLAEKEFYIASFYEIREFYEPAQQRYQKILKTYPETATAKKSAERLKQLPLQNP